MNTKKRKSTRAQQVPAQPPAIGLVRPYSSQLPPGYDLPPLPWTPFEPAMHPDHPDATIFLNSRYQVMVTDLEPHEPGHPILRHLSIKRRDREPIHDWRDLQRIKNELCGPEFEGIEIYPAEERLVDSANQYHLFVFMDSSFRLSMGFSERLVAEGPYTDGARQRPFDDDNRPDDCLTGAEVEAMQTAQGLR